MTRTRLFTLGLFLACCLVWLLPPSVSTAQESAAGPTTTASVSTTPAGSRAAHVVIDADIDTYITRSAERDIKIAMSEFGADVIILEIRTNGGAVGPALDFSRFLKQQQGLRVVAFVRDKAYSAGAMIAVAADEIYMAPGSAIGDCAPIMISPTDGLEPLPEAERAKIESPILAEFLDSSRRNGHDPLMAQAMVRTGFVVHVLEKDGAKKFVDDAEYARLKEQGWKPLEGVPDPLDAKDTLLTVYDDVAQKIGLSRATVDSAEVLSQQRGWSIVTTFKPTLGDSLIALLGSSVVRTLLMSAVGLSLYFSLATPGQGLPETVFVISLGLLLAIPAMTGYAQWYEIAAVIVGIFLLAVELFVLPGFGIAGVSGVLLILSGLVLTFIPVMPALPGDVFPRLPPLSISGGYLINGLFSTSVAVLISVVGGLLLAPYIGRIPGSSGLVLNTTAGTPVDKNAITNESIWPAPGTILIALTDLRPGGNATWDAPQPGAETTAPRTIPVVCDSGFVSAGKSVIVQEISGNRAVVRPHTA